MSSKSLSARGAFGKPSTKRKVSVQKISTIANQMYLTMQQQQHCIEEYYGSLSQITELLEANKEADLIPDWIVKKARTLIDSTTEILARQ